ncbi:hypothetical protein QE385_003955 [Sphingomonas sp. SORGH_AS 950]|uniref:DUF6916 family protein n=1 Tax=Sphingomonas sp. SORGH_AS_0950 TaxID=3041792 RepID=UPI002783526C|nr:hypothetical protein [Sphingomonas sp. SORGH_AS_0950]MDQ1159558.1 hypothetical protein [Sphingomonas sp. SORGH_AS_0950]
MRLLDASDFEAWVGKRVQVTAVPKNASVVLDHIEKNAHPIAIDGFRQPFTLIFSSTLDQNMIDGSYEFDCGIGGPHVIFISQLQQIGNSRWYQAIFN